MCLMISLKLHYKIFRLGVGRSQYFQNETTRFKFPANKDIFACEQDMEHGIN